MLYRKNPVHAISHLFYSTIFSKECNYTIQTISIKIIHSNKKVKPVWKYTCKMLYPLYNMAIILKARAKAAMFSHAILNGNSIDSLSYLLYHFIRKPAISISSFLRNRGGFLAYVA